MSLSRSFPERPTKGSPARSSSRPGPSPTNMRSADGLPTPKTTCVRPEAKPQRVQVDASVATASRACTAAWYRRGFAAPPATRPATGVEAAVSAQLGGELVEQAGELAAALEHGHVPAVRQLDELGVRQ